jgi:hypothetical protein
MVYLLAFSAGVVLAGFFFRRQVSCGIRELDTRQDGELRRANKTIGRLAEELCRERGINRELCAINSEHLKKDWNAVLRDGVIGIIY